MLNYSIILPVSCPHQEISGPSIKSYCERDGEDSSCSGNLLPGTKAMIRCHTGYKQPPRFKTTLTCQESGNWSHSAFECEPICGRVAGHSVPLQFGGRFSTKLQ